VGPSEKKEDPQFILPLCLVLQEECTKTQMNNLDFFFLKKRFDAAEERAAVKHA